MNLEHFLDLFQWSEVFQESSFWTIRSDICIAWVIFQITPPNLKMLLKFVHICLLRKHGKYHEHLT